MQASSFPYTAAMSSSESPQGKASPLTSASGDRGPADSTAKVVLRRGRARPLWFGHPWVYANAVDRIEGQANAGDAVSLVDHDGFVAPAEKMAEELMSSVESRGVGAEEPLHSDDEIGLGSFGHEVEMITH